MATVKHAQIRYLTLNNCFRNKFKKFYWEDLAEECSKAIKEEYGKETSISRETIYADIRYMKSDNAYNAPIESFKDNAPSKSYTTKNNVVKMTKYRKFYRYTDLNFSITGKDTLTVEQKILLKEAVLTLSQLTGKPEFDNLLHSLPQLKIEIDELPKSIISYHNNFDYDFNNQLKQQGIFNAIKNKSVLKISYKSFHDKDFNLYTLHPYHLRQYNQRWFVFGFSSEIYKKHKVEIVNFALDSRFKEMNILNERFIKCKINFDEYFDDFIGVTKTQQKLTKITFEMHPNRYKYVESKPIHQSQKLFKLNPKTGWFKSSIELIPNHEFYQIILSFGADIKVMSPKKIINEMKKNAKSMFQLYS